MWVGKEVHTKALVGPTDFGTESDMTVINIISVKSASGRVASVVLNLAKGILKGLWPCRLWSRIILGKHNNNPKWHSNIFYLICYVLRKDQHGKKEKWISR